ncbi:hypothetical protein G7Y89_g4358 [Cudoniella acicularis]|uniref:Tyrosinase copper-binding domain-containing protein n=1 Tax=Cudoniella acicularis TaxID=354080 RepID=A0A8H4RQF7_9HELO|nr:hypothetical protein G7Y89_g4358 [Cudoniella acicularis]
MLFPRVLSSTILLLASVTACVAAPVDASIEAPRAATCTSKNMLVRKEWRTLSNSDKLSYISAVKCLMSKPPQTSAYFAGVQTRYDDFVALHINSTNYVHFNAPFLAWHRWLLHLWEQELRTTCGYTGTQPWWDFSLDNTIADFANSPLFDDTYGLGGNGAYIADVSNATEFPDPIPVPIPGRTGGGCLETGPFAGLQAHMGIGLDLNYNPHCIRRDFSPTLISEALSDNYIQAAMDSPTFFDLNIAVQGVSLQVSGMRLHAGLHIGIGGQIGEEANMYSSPGDPLFWFIHAALDKLWNDWQQECWETRQTDYSGPDTIWAYPFDFFGAIPYTNVTLGYELEFEHFSSDVKIGDVMNIAASNLCYKYE